MNKSLFFTVINIAHFDNSIILLLLVFEILGFMFSAFFFLHFQQYDSIALYLSL